MPVHSHKIHALTKHSHTFLFVETNERISATKNINYNCGQALLVEDHDDDDDDAILLALSYIGNTKEVELCLT